ncbi:hypothetical protein ACTXJF_09910 [Psychrobacter alimentarius]|uniref:hypothetical protein n=1 Tax=Psychrobacter alimentarius TaxID=261164 RepID=UPI003FD14E84
MTITTHLDAGFEYNKSIADMGSRHVQNRELIGALLYGNLSPSAVEPCHVDGRGYQASAAVA